MSTFANESYVMNLNMTWDVVVDVASYVGHPIRAL